MVEQAVRPAQPDVFHRVAGVVEVRELPAQDVAVIRAQVPGAAIKDTVGAALSDLFATCHREAFGIAGMPFVHYTGWGELVDLEIGVPVLAPVHPAGRVVASTLPGGRAATLVHVGPYEEIERSYGVLQAWFTEHGLLPATRMWETYWTDPATHPDPATWRTELVWPIG